MEEKMNKIPLRMKFESMGIFYIPGIYLLSSFQTAEHLICAILLLFGGVFNTLISYDKDHHLVKKVFEWI
jgi:hypothetical protein